MSNLPTDFKALPGQLWLVNFDTESLADEVLRREIGDDDGMWVGRIIDTNEEDRSSANYSPIYNWRCDQINGTATVYLRPNAATPVRQLVASTGPR